MGKGKTKQKETNQVTRKLIGRWETSIQKWAKNTDNQFPTMHSLCSFKILKKEREPANQAEREREREKVQSQPS